MATYPSEHNTVEKYVLSRAHRDYCHTAQEVGGTLIWGERARGNNWSGISGMVSNTWFPWFPGH